MYLTVLITDISTTDSRYNSPDELTAGNRLKATERDSGLSRMPLPSDRLIRISLPRLRLPYFHMA
jgi:hypothetical protein